MAGESDRFLVRLKAGDADHFRRVLRAQYDVMTMLAGVFVANDKATEIVHAAWLDWIDALERFSTDREAADERVRAVVAAARTQAKEGGQAVDLAAAAAAEIDEPVLPDSRFDPDQSWRTPMKSWDAESGSELHNGKSLWGHIESAIDTLTPPQRAVVILRDIADLPTDAVDEMIGIDPTLQQALLHRAHARLRRAIEIQIGE